MIYKIRAVHNLGSSTTLATEDAREALQSLLAFETAKFDDVTVSDEMGNILMASDLIRIVRSASMSSPNALGDGNRTGAVAA